MGARKISDEELGEVAASCLAMRARLVGRAITSIYEQALRPYGLKVAQMNLLIGAGSSEQIRPAVLGAALHLDPSTLSRTLERLRGEGLLSSAPDEDGRAAPVRLTAKGRRLLGAALPAWRAAQREARALVGPEGERALERMTERVRSRAGA